jgi:hypothetical protein
MSICVYCKQPVNGESREHVITKGLGTFGSNTWILHDKVCGQCNQEFGDTIDLELTNNSYEGLKRVSLIPDKRMRKYGKSNVKLYIPLDYPDEHVRGAPINVHKFVNEQLIEFLPCIKIWHLNQKKYIYIELEDLKELDQLTEAEYNFIDCSVHGNNKEEFEDIMIELARLNIKLDIKGTQYINPQLVTRKFPIEGIITKNLKRAISKIAFNYITFHYPEIDLLQSEFDTTRDFIKNKNDAEVVKLVDKLLAEESENVKISNEKSILICAEIINGILVVKVQIYTLFTYQVTIGAVDTKEFTPLGYYLEPRKEPVKLQFINFKYLELYTFDTKDGSNFFLRKI